MHIYAIRVHIYDCFCKFRIFFRRPDVRKNLILVIKCCILNVIKIRNAALLWGKTMKLEKFAVSDYETIRDFMTPIWHNTYAFLPREQVELLLDKYFSEDGLKHYRELGYTYMKLVDKKTVGIVVFCEREDETYLDKLYLSEDSRGKGYPSFVFAELLSLGRDITLNVNQSNERAVACYRKNGFVIEKEELIDLGGGMVNRDYRMRLTLENFKNSGLV